MSTKQRIADVTRDRPWKVLEATVRQLDSISLTRVASEVLKVFRFAFYPTYPAWRIGKTGQK